MTQLSFSCQKIEEFLIPVLIHANSSLKNSSVLQGFCTKDIEHDPFTFYRYLLLYKFLNH